MRILAIICRWPAARMSVKPKEWMGERCCSDGVKRLRRRDICRQELLQRSVCCSKSDVLYLFFSIAD